MEASPILECGAETCTRELEPGNMQRPSAHAVDAERTVCEGPTRPPVQRRTLRCKAGGRVTLSGGLAELFYAYFSQRVRCAGLGGMGSEWMQCGRSEAPILFTVERSRR